MKTKFYRCNLFTYYYGHGIFWFRLIRWGLSFKHINDYAFSESEERAPKGILYYYWLINFIK